MVLTPTDAHTFNNSAHHSAQNAKALCLTRLTAIEDLTQALQTTRTAIEGVARALNTSLSDVQAAIHEIEDERARVVRARGLARLPDEVLGLVFVAVMDDCDSSESTFALSAVCRRFRAIALSTSRLWSHISSYTHFARLTTNICLERSQPSGLHLNLRKMDVKFHPAVWQHRRRWESISTFVEGEESQIFDLFPVNEQDALPRLRSVTLYNTLDTLVANKLVKSWSISARNLRHLNFSISSPSQHILPASLTRLELRLYPEDTSLSSRDTISLLQSAPLLEDIKLDLRGVEYFTRYNPPRCRSQPKGRNFFSFSRVKKVALSFSAEYGLIPLFKVLHFPNAEQFAISVDEKDRDPESEMDPYYDDEYGGKPEREIDDIGAGLNLVDAIFFEGKEYPLLTTLSLRFHFPEEYDCEPDFCLDESVIEDIADHCPSLQHLTFECTVLIERLNLPSLSNLTLVGCTLKDTKWLVDYEDELQENEAWSSFGILRLLGCKLADRQRSTWDTLRSFYGSKLELF
ncbi:hypothetical protein SCHPADRAFT_300197 [Schizopora paradoxa]|uniref:F-box domain-containing protein n=1 Tax=Schizopora paradoxa TaxID=27342 RepID=A0A0H2SCG8_9AGAM|nr:hypothetical protein SCHPADRAFT_300197 [Schizopora paradoxa]